MTYNKILAGDIGGSHISVASFKKSGQATELIEIKRIPVDSKESKDNILASWNRLFKELAGSDNEILLGLAMPAPFDYENGICWIKDQGKFLNLYGLDLKREISESNPIKQDNIKFVNDAEAFLLGETTYGEGKGCEKLMGITLGSGLGTSFKIYDSFKDAALWSAPFKEGIAEDYLGTAWFVNWAKTNMNIKISGVKELTNDLKIIDKSRPAFREFSSNLADFISIYDQKYDFDKIILGGNITKASFLFYEDLLEALNKNGCQKPVCISKLGEKSAFYGVLASIMETNKTSFQH
jgi:glucokinase